MKFLKFSLLMLMVVTSYAAKVTWDENGKPIISQSDKPIKGCSLRGLEETIKENNSSSCS